MVRFCDEELLKRYGTNKWFNNEAMAQRVRIYTYMGAPNDEISDGDRLYILNSNKIYLKYETPGDGTILSIGRRWKYENSKITNITRLSRKRLCVGEINYKWKLRELVSYIANRLHRPTGWVSKYHPKFDPDKWECDNCRNISKCQAHHNPFLKESIQLWFYSMHSPTLVQLLQEKTFLKICRQFGDYYFDELNAQIFVLCHTCHQERQHREEKRKYRKIVREEWQIFLDSLKLPDLKPFPPTKRTLWM